MNSLFNGSTVRMVAGSIVFLYLAPFCQPTASGQSTASRDLPNPAERKTTGGELATRLTVAYSDHKIGKQAAHLRNYENLLTGPTLRVRPGDTLNILLVNDLPKEPPGHGAKVSRDNHHMPPREWDQPRPNQPM